MTGMTFSRPSSGHEHYQQRVAGLCRMDPQVRAAAPRRDVLTAAQRPGLSLAESVDAIMTGYADRPALGERVREVVTDQATGTTGLRLTRRLRTITYRELWSRAGAVAAAWHHDPRVPVRRGDFVATLGFVSSDHIAVLLACVRLGAVSVPLQASAAPGTLKPIIAETGPRLLATSVASLGTAIGTVAGSQSVRRLVVFDYAGEDDAHRQALEAARSRLAQAGSGIVIDTLADVVAAGAALPPVPCAAADPARPDPLSLLLYTSGSTGTPKGAMYTERLAKDLWREYWPGKDHPVIGLNYAPMSHVMGQLILFSTLASGGTAYFVAAADMSTMLEDYQLVRPTELVLVPRVCEMLFQHFQSELGRHARTPGPRAALAAKVAGELRGRTLGGRVVWAGCGSAPLSAELAAFMESVLQLPLHDGYGATETGSVFPLQDGRVAPRVQQYRLADVPELGYFRTDAPYPRGELLLKSDGFVPGYFKRPDVTAQAFDDEGFYHTGDIMAEVSPGRFAYVDRRNNVLKLSQAEFVTLSKLEAVFGASPLIRQIYVYGNSERSYLLAVVVPAPQALEQAGGDEDRLKTAIAGSLRQLAKDAELNSYEVPRDFLVETEPFTVENGLLSGVRKLLRPKLAERYGDQLEARYAEIARREADELRQLRQAGRDQPVTGTVVRAARALLGAAAAPEPDAHFTDLGGDSLSALEFTTLLQEIYGVEVPASVVLSPASDLAAIAGHIEQALRPGAARAAFGTVHRGGGTVVRAADLTLEKFIDRDTLAKAASLPRDTGSAQGPGGARTVLLTGANGYLGRFLCLEWLERTAATGGRVVCVIRGSSAEAARARLGAAVGEDGDGDLPRRFRELARGRLEVLPGDIGEPGLGLDPETWHELAAAVDLIIHPAALVNHVLPYQQLLRPNVAGPAELIRLALTTRIKPVSFVSSVAVVAAQVSSADEDADIRVTSPERTLDESYANGYATSKWAAEVLLRQAHDAFGLPVAVFRPGMILAHRRFPGQLNVPDMFTRLLLSVLATGIAPGSFYATKDPAHYDGLPAGFVAEAVAALGSAAVAGYRTYNVVNPHQDGISLDTYVDWLAGAGYPIKRIDDYAIWLSRFETALRALPDKQKQHSLLPLLHAFAKPAEAVDGSAIPSRRFRAAVRDSGIGPGGGIPPVTPDLIRKYAADLTELGLI